MPLAIVLDEARWHGGLGEAITGVADGAGHTGGAASAGARTFPGEIRMRFADPAAIVTALAAHVLFLGPVTGSV
jgi:hypothetical protein